MVLSLFPGITSFSFYPGISTSGTTSSSREQQQEHVEIGHHCRGTHVLQAKLKVQFKIVWKPHIKHSER